MRPHAGSGAAIVIACVLVTPAVAAQTDVEAAYKQHMKNGVKLYQDGNYRAAVAEFDAAYAAQAKPSPLINIALCEKALFHYPKAIDALERALSKHEAQLTAADRKAANDALTELRGLLAFIEVKVTPPEATISVDGEPLPAGSAKGPVPLGPGQHEIAAEAPGYSRQAQNVSVVSGEKGKSLTFLLVADKGYVSLVAGDPRTGIEVDGKRMGAGQWAGLLAPGPHSVGFASPGAPPHVVTITVAAGKSQEIDARAMGMAPPAFVPGEGYPGAHPDTAKPPAPQKPPLRGFYGLVGANLFLNASEPSDFDGNRRPGGGFAIHLGYRPTTLVGLELMFQYGDLTTDGTLSHVIGPDTDAGYSLATSLIGGGIRLMTSGRVVRFVTTLSLGLAYNVLTWEGCPGAELITATSACHDGEGADAFANAEVGLELDFGGVLVGLVAQPVIMTSGGLTGDFGAESFSDPIALVGGGLRIGYGTW